MRKTATKAVTVLVTGANTWCAQYLTAKTSAAIAVAAATILAFLVPNVTKDDRQPVARRDWGREGGGTRATDAS